MLLLSLILANLLVHCVVFYWVLKFRFRKVYGIFKQFKIKTNRLHLFYSDFDLTRYHQKKTMVQIRDLVKLYLHQILFFLEFYVNFVQNGISYRFSDKVYPTVSFFMSRKSFVSEYIYDVARENTFMDHCLFLSNLHKEKINHTQRVVRWLQPSIFT